MDDTSIAINYSHRQKNDCLTGTYANQRVVTTRKNFHCTKLSLAIAISLHPFIFPMAPCIYLASFPGHIPHLLMYYEKIGVPGDEGSS